MRTLLATLTLLLAAAAPVLAQPADPIRIGVLVDQSSVFSGADGGGSVLAARMAVEDFGAKVLGRPVEIVAADHQNKPDVGSAVAREWFSTQGVLAIAGGANSAVAFAAQDIARQADRIYLNVNGTSSDLSNKACSPNSIYWGIDTYALAKTTGDYVTSHGALSWFFVTSDYTFGHALQRDTASAVKASCGSMVGEALHPFNNADFASQLLQAQGSGAQVVAFANSGDDFTNAMKQATEFGLPAKQRMVGLLVFMTNLEALGLKGSQGLQFATPGEWTATPAIEQWSRRFMARDEHHVPPVPGQMGMYGAVRHYLRAVEAAGSTDAKAVMAKMKEMPTDDFATAGSRIRADGRLMFPVHIVQVKTPEESKFDFDYVKDIATIPADQAFRPLSESQCPLVNGAK